MTEKFLVHEMRFREHPIDCIVKTLKASYISRRQIVRWNGRSLK